MNVLIIGKNGQLAWELCRLSPEGLNVRAYASTELDITQKASIEAAFEKVQPQLVINCAAYTAVDKAESDSEQAYAVNAQGARDVALACKKANARLLHISTDFVFDGSKTTPYQVDDATNPLGVYGASKLAGEKAVLEVLPQTCVIVRTAWVYSSNGNNFVKTMLRLMSEKPSLGVVGDQVGTPTWAKGLAEWLWCIAQKPSVSGMYHWTDAGTASWYDFAVAIQELGVQKGLLKNAIPIAPIPATDYPTPARRPSFSIIDKQQAERAADLKTSHWRKQLSAMMDEL